MPELFCLKNRPRDQQNHSRPHSMAYCHFRKQRLFPGHASGREGGRGATRPLEDRDRRLQTQHVQRVGQMLHLQLPGPIL